jgi:hypothetical protein
MKGRLVFGLFFLMTMFFISGCIDDATTTNPRAEITATISINLSTDDGGSANGAYVILTNNNGNPAHTRGGIVTDNVITFSSITFGTYTLIVSHEDYKAYTNRNLSIRSEDINESITLLSIEEEIPMTATVNINLSTNNLGSVNGAFIILTSDSDTYARIATDNAIQITDVAFGVYSFIISHEGYHTFKNTISIQAPILNQTIILQTHTYDMNTATVNINLSTNNLGSVNGAYIILSNNNGNVAHIHDRIATGSLVSFSVVTYGSYTLLVSHGGYQTFINNNLIINSATITQSVILQAQVPEINSGTVVITLNTFDDEPVSGAIVGLTNNNANPAHVYGQIATGQNITFSNVVFGTYTLRISHSGYGTFIDNNVSVAVAFVNQTVTLQEFSIGCRGPAGGVVFFDKGFSSNGWRYLEAAPTNSEFIAQWGGIGHNVVGTLTGVGDGRNNTELIVAALNLLGEEGRAAQLCIVLDIDGFDDWFLPSRDELHELFRNRHVIDGFSAAWYWSSSQGNTDQAWSQFFHGAGVQDNQFKSGTQRTRAIRAF